MPLSEAELRSASVGFSPRSQSLGEARRLGIRTVFLCHSHLDVSEAEGLAALLARAGWDVYIDWKDASLPAIPDRQTADRIRNRIRASAFLLYLATEASSRSRWCPWEIGIADGEIGGDQVIVVPTIDDRSITHGQEYLHLYRRLDRGESGHLGVWEPGQDRGRRVNTL